ncbi:NDP-hexose 2,3-dehydratase family protein [Streptomyces sp. RerS4]|uniref:NDP-hexose 2,3-dehydratase family protein n=1 Tax=Streptomyces sp. RerS4 TaxID=2942449 RepID=UPI00201BF9A8|nr:NDP-hexose 2,3-dehydratase family protein [Streptomyces sp. RerS4]UQX03431.1 NDP-hexose 2,3-dehydratase family protein [Streptomyces sp. RerS4]
MTRTNDTVEWLARRAQSSAFQVSRIPFADLDGWEFTADTGNLVHRSGRYFSVEGYHVTVEDRNGGTAPREWHQPILNQPEHAILGILVKEIDGELHALLQAKMEPGNINMLQLSPTVQATWSNYTRVHRGAAVRYLEYFTTRAHGRVIADVLQSEQGSWFDRKTNRNIIVEVTGDVPAHDDYRWFPLSLIGELLLLDNVINMDTRSVLSCLPAGHVPGAGKGGADIDLLSWITGVRARYHVSSRLVPLDGLPGWKRGEWSVDNEYGRYFRIVAASVRADTREVSGWTQPLLEPIGRGVACFLARRHEGSLQVLAHARTEAGFVDAVELGPTVQCTPDNHAHLPPQERPAFLDLVMEAGEQQIIYDAVHSEEGGRFLNAESRYLVVEVAPDLDVPDDFRWVTPAQMTSLARHGHYLNMQARTLLTCLNLAVPTGRAA